MDKNYNKEKGCGKKLDASIYDTGKYHTCGSHNWYTKEGHYLLRHRNMVLCDDCKKITLLLETDE